LTTGEARDSRLVFTLLPALKSGALLLAGRGYDADWIGSLVSQRGAWANIPAARNRKEPICFSPRLYPARNLTTALTAGSSCSSEARCTGDYYWTIIE
jgi:hypothetical protein